MKHSKTPEIKAIYKKIRQLENRDTADAMERMGMRYKVNHGLLLNDLQILANDYSGRNDLAEELRSMPEREARLLAEMIAEHSGMDAENLADLGKTIDTSELAEQTAVNISKDTPRIKEIALSWAKSEQLYTAAAGFNLLSFSADSFEEDAVHIYLDLIKQHPRIKNKELQKYAARFLRKLAAAGFKEIVLQFSEEIQKQDKDLSLLTEETIPFIRYIR